MFIRRRRALRTAAVPAREEIWQSAVNIRGSAQALFLFRPSSGIPQRRRRHSIIGFPIRGMSRPARCVTVGLCSIVAWHSLDFFWITICTHERHLRTRYITCRHHPRHTVNHSTGSINCFLSYEKVSLAECFRKSFADPSP